jgi:signal transduction histidine kinase
MLQSFSIRTRLLFLSGALLAIVAGATYYLTTKLAENSRAITRNAELAELIDIAQDVRNLFGQYRYWTTDLAVSLLRQSEINANTTRDRLLQRLDDLALRKPDVAAALKEQIRDYETAAMNAVEQYTDDQRVLGNTFLAQARQHSVVIDDRLSAVVDDLNHEVVQARDQVVADVTQATQIAYVIVAVAILLGIATTLVVLRSILVPLRHVISAMDGITAGDLNIPIPPASGDEIGVMAKTLRLFRESIIERTRLLNEIQDKSRQLAEASQHKSQFLANMSHELRTPLSAILGYTELILDNLYGETPDKMRGVLDRIQKNGRHLLGLINDVLDLSKIEAGQLTLTLTDYSLKDVVHSVFSAVEPLATAKHLSFKVEVPQNLPPGHGDERRITQVLLNLVGNAIKFTDKGEVAIKALATNGSFTVAVCDSGPGIGIADQAKIFEEFKQADSSITHKKGGTGLGLSISKRIIEMHGGRLWVESDLGQGATFLFTVPAIVEQQVEQS